MRMKIFPWRGREFVAFSAEGNGVNATAQAQHVFQHFDKELKKMGLTLENTVYTRVWARDGESRRLGADERNKVLSGKARSASSSYTAPAHFESNAQVALDLLAMRPSEQQLEKKLKEYDPPRIPLRYFTYDGFAFLSGVTSAQPNLIEQTADILSCISGSLKDAETSWNKAVKVALFLHRSQKLDVMKKQFQEAVKADIPLIQYAFVDGFATEGRLVEVEVTATL